MPGTQTQKPRVALISPIPEFDMIVKDDVLKVHTTVDPFTGSSITYREPIALEFIDAHLRKHGYPVQLFTETHMTAEQVMREVEQFDPSIVGISVHSAVVRPDTLEIAGMLKNWRPDVHVIIGGYHPTGEVMEYKNGNLEREELLLDSSSVDVIGYGEGEQTFLEVADALNNGGDLSGVLGIAYKKDGTIIVNPRRPRVSFHELPWPTRYRDVLKSARCAPLAHPAPNEQRGAAQISGSRGCRHGCDFCPSMTIWPAGTKGSFGRSRGEPVLGFRPVEDIVAEMKYLETEFGINFFTFTDLTFNENPDYVKRLTDAMLAEGVTHKPNGKDDIGWFAYATVEATLRYPQTIQQMADAGCTRIGVGVESLHRAVLKGHKPINTREKELKALEAINASGALNRTYFIVGWPEETPEMFDETEQMLLSGQVPADQLRLAFITPFLGTPLYSKYRDRLLTKDWRRYTGDQPIVRNDHMTPEEMKTRVGRMLQGYYQSDTYARHVREKVGAFPHLRKSFLYFEEFLQKREIIPTSRHLLE